MSTPRGGPGKMTNPDDEAAAAQLHHDLNDSIRQAHRTARPILTHLNADTTWLLSIPKPDYRPFHSTRSRYNLLIDPWLQGPQSDVAGWFSKQWHAVESSVGSILELDELLRDAEAFEYERHATSETTARNSYIDAVVISHEFTDHCHKATLLEVNTKVPVFATGKAAQLIRSWNHFSTVIEMASFGNGEDWRTTSTPPLPEWIGISRIVTSSDALYYHSAVLICTRISDSESEAAEAVIYTPHGLAVSGIATITTAKPPIDSLALLHGLHDISLVGNQLNLGAVNAIKAQQLLNAKFWIGTHDEEKKKWGLISPFLRRKPLTVSEAFAQVQATAKVEFDGTEAMIEEPIYVELGNGESLLLA
ncbi:hypothetical protein LTR84_012884 [Exophiala bonariae]|uniref:CN hydrolase domain-containing protein n=1 Tax=Exophiala bonariae TaxID=1690606 RepID=A0AAV9NHS0_9EURO|nr:hypothetical protein LTR84_012884 [Exophiala bonariae]